MGRGQELWVGESFVDRKRHLCLPLSSEVTLAGQEPPWPQGEEEKGCNDISGLLQALCASPMGLGKHLAAGFPGREKTG